MARWHHFGILPGDRVLDVGCGFRPFAFATHLADISLVHRWVGRPFRVPRDGRPFVRCSVEALPFRDHAFEFVFCAHVLEHVRDPGAACRELMRVARRGYVECPRSWLEILTSADDHRWLVDCEAGVLVFREKLDEERGDPLGLRFRFLDWMREPRFLVRWNSRRVHSVFNVELEWRGRLPSLVLTKTQRAGTGRHRPPTRRHKPQGPPTRARS